LNDRLRVLLIAEAANPEWTSVPLLGWSFAEALAKVANVHLVTQVRNRDALVRKGWTEGQEFTALDTEAVAKPMHRMGQLLRGGAGKGWTTVMAVNALPYYYFERKLWQTFGPAIRAGEYDVVHRHTPLTPILPSIIAPKCKAAGVPFVWGPINGGTPWPKGFGDVRRKEREWLSYVRQAYKLLPGYRATREAAAAIMVASHDTREQLGAEYFDKAVYLPENGLDVTRFSRHNTGEIRSPLRVCFIGRLVPYKGADMLIQAAAPLVKAGKVVVDIIGDGPEMPRLKAMVDELGVESGVKLDGWVPHERLQDRVLESDVFGFPSVREFGGGVVIEAMILGLVPIVVDHGGPAELVTGDTGYKLPIASRDQIVNDLRALLERLAGDPSELIPRRSAAIETARRLFTWEAKARQIGEVYRWVLGQRAQKPRFDFPNEA
jgi:glycosyltransferase involved in cell wall biosynthesis